MKHALKAAGLILVKLIVEPCATLLPYIGKKLSSEDHGRWLVFDFGGAHFDATLFEVTSNRLRIIGYRGDNIGGHLIDERITDELLAPRIRQHYDVTDFHRGVKRWNRSFARLDLLSEEAKIQLSKDRNRRGYMFRFQNLGIDDRGRIMELDYEESREAVMDIAFPFFMRAMALCRELHQQDSKNNKSFSHHHDLRRIIRAGGSAIFPEELSLFGEEFNSGTSIDVMKNPFTVQTTGTAMIAEWPNMPTELKSMELVDCVLDKDLVLQ